MPPESTDPVLAEDRVAFRSSDGLRLFGTLAAPRQPAAGAAVLVHGGGVTREEGGFFTRLAAALAAAGIASLRFDFRGHGESEGRQKDLTICGVANDISAAVEEVRSQTGTAAAHLVGASFGGGITGFYAAHHSDQVRSLVLLNPLLNYKKRFVDDKPYWVDDRISVDAGRELAELGYLEHSPAFKLGRALLNEVFFVRPHLALRDIAAPALFIHGTGDTFIPVESSRAAVAQIRGESRLVEIEGAQHGIAVPDDPGYHDPQTQQWQATAIRAVVDWIVAHNQAIG
jgi:pimeloyl-ACP methyl ester carboxylesterase